MRLFFKLVYGKRGSVREQGLIQDFLLGGGTIFLKNFWIFSDSKQTNSVIIIIVIVLILFVCQFIIYINIMHVFQCVRGFARGGKLSLGGGRSQGSPPSVLNPGEA